MSELTQLFTVTERRSGYGHLTLRGTCMPQVTDDAVKYFAGRFSGCEGFPLGTRDWSRSADKKNWSITIHTN